MDYVSLHNHTVWSLMGALNKPADLFARAKELGQSAIAVTDYSTMAAAWDSLKASKKTGVKLIIGCNFNFVDNIKDEDAKIRHLILLAKNHNGYKNLLLATKLAYDNHIMLFKKVVPRIDWKILERCSEDLICTTSGSDGILSRLINTRQFDKAKSEAQRLKDIFGDNLALEIQPHTMKRNASPYNDYEDQTLVNRRLIKIGDELGIKVIAATDAHYLKKDDHAAHDVLLSIGSSQPVRAVARLKYPAQDFYVKSREEVEGFFERLYKERAKEFCDNTLYFANMCEYPEWIDPKFSNPSGKELPEFPVKNEKNYKDFKVWRQQNDIPENMAEDVAYLRYWCDKEFLSKVPKGKEDEYRARLKEELQVIEKLGFSSYMLIVADIIRYAIENNIPVGPGRGSVAGCLLAYIIGIHQADPIKYGLIFARFLNIYKQEYPDIDMDFASFGKEVVQAYICEKYGNDYVAHVSNIITMTPKPYAKDIARAFLFGGDRKACVKVGEAIAEAIPSDIGSVTQALNDAPLFIEYAQSEKYGVLQKYAEHLDGIPKAWATHAGGVIIGKRPLVEIVPLRVDDKGQVAVQYEKKRAEANGLVKMDILAVSNLDVISNALRLIKASGAAPPFKEIIDYDANDKKTYDLISSGNTLGVFQLGKSGGTINLCRQIKPKCIEDLAIINALARPNAKDIRKDFINSWQSGKEVELIHPFLKRAFSSTRGFAVFEECLMWLAQDVAGWDMTEADRLRKLTKDKGKNPKQVAKWREDFIDSSIENKELHRKIATKIWDDIIDKFQGYAFNKSLHLSECLDIYNSSGKFLKFKMIKDVQPNDYVRSRDESSGKDIFVRVKAKHDHGKLPLVEVELDSGEKIKCTINHKFRVQENGKMWPLWKIMKENLSIVVDSVGRNI